MLGKVDIWPNYQHHIVLLELLVTHFSSEYTVFPSANIWVAKAFIFIKLPIHGFI